MGNVKTIMIFRCVTIKPKKMWSNKTDSEKRVSVFFFFFFFNVIVFDNFQTIVLCLIQGIGGGPISDWSRSICIKIHTNIFKIHADQVHTNLDADKQLGPDIRLNLIRCVLHHPNFLIQNNSKKN